MPISKKRRKKNHKGQPTLRKSALKVKDMLDTLSFLESESIRLEAKAAAEKNKKEN